MIVTSGRQAILVASIISWSCVGSEMANASCEWDVFRQLPSSDARAAALPLCTPDQQVDLYLRWAKLTVPGNYDLDEAIARRGSLIIPAIMRRFAGDEVNVNDWRAVEMLQLITVLRLMQVGGYHQVLDDQSLIAHLEKEIDSVSNPILRSSLSEEFSRLISVEQ